jgi:hypothetical protein
LELANLQPSLICPERKGEELMRDSSPFFKKTISLQSHNRQYLLFFFKSVFEMKSSLCYLLPRAPFYTRSTNRSASGRKHARRAQENATRAKESKYLHSQFLELANLQLALITAERRVECWWVRPCLPRGRITYIRRGSTCAWEAGERIREKSFF